MSVYLCRILLATLLLPAGCSDRIHKRDLPTVEFVPHAGQQTLTAEDYAILRAVVFHTLEKNESRQAVLSPTTLGEPYVNALEYSHSLDCRLGVNTDRLRPLFKSCPLEHSMLALDGTVIVAESTDSDAAPSATHLSMTHPVYSTEGDAYVFLFERRGGNGGSHLIKLEEIRGEWIINTDELLGIM